MALGGLLSVGGGLLGAIAGGQRSRSRQTTESGVRLALESAEEKQFRETTAEQFGQLRGLVGAGPGQQDVQAGLGAQRDLAAMLQQLSQTGGLPGQQDISAARGLAADIFAPEQQAIRAGFGEQQQRTAQLAAQLGRPVNDPILQARLAQEQTRQLGALGARQTAFSAEQAQRLPLQRLGFAGQLADVRSGLASQALANRQTLLGMGQQLQQAERQFRLGTGTRFSTAEQQSGGGLGGAISGGLAGFGQFASVGQKFGLNPFSFGGGGGQGAMQAPASGGPAGLNLSQIGRMA